MSNSAPDANEERLRRLMAWLETLSPSEQHTVLLYLEKTVEKAKTMNREA
jgi:hypothetical protein